MSKDKNSPKQAESQPEAESKAKSLGEDFFEFTWQQEITGKDIYPEEELEDPTPDKELEDINDRRHRLFLSLVHLQLDLEDERANKKPGQKTTLFSKHQKKPFILRTQLEFYPPDQPKPISPIEYSHSTQSKLSHSPEFNQTNLDKTIFLGSGKMDIGLALKFKKKTEEDLAPLIFLQPISIEDFPKSQLHSYTAKTEPKAEIDQRSKTDLVYSLKLFLEKLEALSKILESYLPPDHSKPDINHFQTSEASIVKQYGKQADKESCTKKTVEPKNYKEFILGVALALASIKDKILSNPVKITKHQSQVFESQNSGDISAHKEVLKLMSDLEELDSAEEYQIDSTSKASEEEFKASTSEDKSISEGKREKICLEILEKAIQHNNFMKEIVQPIISTEVFLEKISITKLKNAQSVKNL